MSKILVPAVLVLLACATGLLVHRGLSCGAREAQAQRTVTVTDLAGRRVTLNTPIERIVLVRGRDIYALGLLLGGEIEGKLVAWGPDLESCDNDAYRRFLASHPRLAEVPKLGSVYQDALSPEAVLALGPDLVIVDLFMADRGYRCVERMKQAGLPLVFLDFSRDPLSNPQRSLEVLGRALGKEDRARKINAFIDAELDKVLARLPERDDDSAPSIYVEAGYQGAAEYGPTYGYACDAQGRMTGWGAVLDRLGAKNIAGGVVPHRGPIHPEHLFKTDPDVIVITGACWSSPSDATRLGYYTEAGEARRRLAAFTARPGWKELSAVRSGRVYGLYHNFSMQMTDFVAVQQLARWLYPGRFDDLDPQSAHRDFHERFMPVEYGGVWTIGLEPAP